MRDIDRIREMITVVARDALYRERTGYDVDHIQLQVERDTEQVITFILSSFIGQFFRVNKEEDC